MTDMSDSEALANCSATPSELADLVDPAGECLSEAGYFDPVVVVIDIVNKILTGTYE